MEAVEADSDIIVVSSDSGADVDSDPPASEGQNDEISSEEGDLEPWVEWVRRTTHAVESHLTTMDVENWACQARRRKWRWAAPRDNQRVTPSSDDL